MISRETTKVLAEVYDARFGEYRQDPPYYYKEYHLHNESLYDFLYENNYEAWFMNAVRQLTGYERELKMFIMRLHTGETVVGATANWTWEQRQALGQRLLRDLAENIIVWGEKVAIHRAKSMLPQLKSRLELDEYIFRDGKLYYSETAVLDIKGEVGILEKMIKDLQLDKQDVMKHHLELSETHYLGEKWDDSIANSRKFLECVLQEITAKHHLLKASKPIDLEIYSRPAKVRDYLETKGLLEAKEKKAIAEVYGLLSETGSHPYIAEKDQARLMRYLALTFAQFVLLRFQGFIFEQSQKRNEP